MFDLMFTSFSPGPDLLRFAFVVGILVSLALYERLHLGTGSVIVPGYLGVMIFHPQMIFVNLLVAYIAFRIVHRMIGRIFFIVPTRKYAYLIAVSVTLQLLLSKLIESSALGDILVRDTTAIGYVIPGLIAHEMSRQTPRAAAANVLLGSALVGIALIIVVTIAPDLARHNQKLLSSSDRYFLFASRWLPIMLLLSVTMALVLRRSNLRCGGYVTTAYVAMQCASPPGLILLLTQTAVTYLLVKKLLMPRMIIFGRRKFAAMLLTGALVSWTSIVVIDSATGGRSGSLGFTAFSVMSIVLSGLLANDVERVGVRGISQGLLLNIGFVVCGTLLVSEFSGPARIEVLIASGGASAAILGFALKPACTENASGRSKNPVTELA